MLSATIDFVAAASLVIVVPGPDTLVVLRALLQRGRRAAQRTALGVLTGLCVWASCAVLGITTLLRATDDGYTVLRLAGAAYLAVLGVRSLRGRGATVEVVQPAGKRDQLLRTGYGGGLATNLLNPKVGVFFVSFLPALVPSHAPLVSTSLLFGGLFVAEVAVYFVVLLRATDVILRALRRERLRLVVDRCAGVVLIGLALRIAVER